MRVVVVVIGTCPHSTTLLGPIALVFAVCCVDLPERNQWPFHINSIAFKPNGAWVSPPHQFGFLFTHNHHTSEPYRSSTNSINHNNACPARLDRYPSTNTSSLQDSSHRHLVRRRGRTQTCAQTFLAETQALETGRFSRNIGRKTSETRPA